MSAASGAGLASGALLAAAGVLVGLVACARQQPRAHQVEMKNFAFAPAAVVVTPGDTVVWKNGDFVPHTTTARDAAWDSKSVDGEGTYRWVAARTGRHEYYCVLHPSMKGTVEVR